jgi:hypothetical protein
MERTYVEPSLSAFSLSLLASILRDQKSWDCIRITRRKIDTRFLDGYRDGPTSRTEGIDKFVVDLWRCKSRSPVGGRGCGREASVQQDQFVHNGVFRGGNLGKDDHWGLYELARTGYPTTQNFWLVI